MENEKTQEHIVRPETPRSEDPARLNDLNPDNDTKEIARETEPKVTPEQKRQTQGQVRSPRSGREPDGKKKQRNPRNEQPTNPPHNENDGQLWATEEQGKTNDAKA
jgi:hypothetical protein